MEQYDDTVNHYREGLTLRQNSLPPEYPDIAVPSYAVGTVLIKNDSPSEAETFFRRSLDIRQDVYEEGDWRIAQVESHLGRSLLHQQKYEEAEILLGKSRTVLEKAFGPDNAHTLRVIEDLNELTADRE